MQRLKRKQLEKLQQEKYQLAQEQFTALKQLIKGQESLQITLTYCKEFLSSGKPVENLTEYSPTQISRLVFDQQLELIKQQMEKLPGGRVKVEHFLVVMLKVMNFPFEKAPYYLVGLKDMFRQMVEQNEQSVDYTRLFKYILGELVSLQEQEQNTEFQVQLRERKRQDYLMHDNGIKRLRYSKDLKLMISLDQRANTLRLYNDQMRSLPKFSPKKDKHNNKFPAILDFDYAEISGKLGLILADDTLSVVHLSNFLNKSQAQFESMASNEVVFPLPERMSLVFFLQMVNKWLTVSQQGGKLWLFDMERVRNQPQKVQQKLSVDLGETTLSDLMEVVGLSCVCLVAANEVHFYNENLTDVKFTKFTHGEQIRHFRYSQEKGQFYLCGKEKSITIFSIGRNGSPSKIWNITINRIIVDFEVFPHFDTIVIADEVHDVRLIQQGSRAVYQQVSYAHIVKAKEQPLALQKMNKHEFALYQTYMIVVAQEKVAIERDTEYGFLTQAHFDPKRQELFLSLNNQILSFSLITADVRSHHAPDNSNLLSHTHFFLAPRTPLFVLDQNLDLYEIFSRSDRHQGENKHYRKRVGVESVIGCHYDEQLRQLVVVGKDCYNQIRNDGNNSFTSINSLNFENFAPFISSHFCSKGKIISLLSSDQKIYQLRNYEPSIMRCIRFRFPQDPTDHEQRLITSFFFDSPRELFVVTSNRNEVYFIDTRTQKQFCFRVQQNLPNKLKHLRFMNCRYQLLDLPNNPSQPYLLLTDQTGFLLQFALAPILLQYGLDSKTEEPLLKPMYKDTQTVENINIPIEQISLNQNKRLKRSYAELGLLKAHEKQIAIAIKVRIQITATLTVSVDGYVRLWNASNQCLFSLKIPALTKVSWNMKQIEDIRNKKSIDEVLSIFREQLTPSMQEQLSPVQTYQKSKKLKHKAQPPRANPIEPFRIDIENKDVEELVMQKQDYLATFHSTRDKSRTTPYFHSTQKVYPHPWRTKREFQKIYEKASPPHKYQRKIPHDLLQLRTSLDMTQKQREQPNYKQAERILPQLSFYQVQRTPQRKPVDSAQDPTEGQTFESCLYIKSARKKKKINELDQIDKEFKKKEMLMTARKWVPKKRQERSGSVMEAKAEATIAAQGRVDPIRAIQHIFELHNKECLEKKTGRLIRIPHIQLQRDFY